MCLVSLGRVHFLRRGPSRSILDHLAKEDTHEGDTCTGDGRPSDGECRRDPLATRGWRGMGSKSFH
eukprot:8056140-Pyramimonas_sp.AAC.1